MDQGGEQLFQHTAARRRLLGRSPTGLAHRLRFNTQPHGGGCSVKNCSDHGRTWFQHTAARRRLPCKTIRKFAKNRVSTHSRTEAAASDDRFNFCDSLFQHTAARRRLLTKQRRFTRYQLFQHTAARRRLLQRTLKLSCDMCFNTQPHGGGCSINRTNSLLVDEFQHTAARRRLRK